MPNDPRSSIPNYVTPDALRGLDSWALPPDGPLQIGATFLNGKYEIRGLLGTGGYAFVYDAHDAYLNVDVALKIIPNPPEPARAKQEARVGMRLVHPKIVKTLGGGVDDGLAYIVMEKLEGWNVRQAMAQFGPLTAIEALIIAGQVAEAAAYAHGQGIVHRDLKPDNAFLTAGNSVCVLDFGIAKVVEGAALTTQKDIIHGTISYISPEQIMGGSATVRSDIFALGTMMFEMIYGKAPVVIGLEEATFASIASAQLCNVPPRLDKICPGIPRQVGRIVHKALAKKPEERFESMATLAQYCFAAAKEVVDEGAARGLDVRPRDLWKQPSSARVQPASTGPDREERVMMFTTQRTPGAARSSRVGPSLGTAPASAATQPLYRVGSELLNGRPASQSRTARELPKAPSHGLQDRQRFVRVLGWTALGSTVVAFTLGGVIRALSGAPASRLVTPPAASAASVPVASVPVASVPVALVPVASVPVALVPAGSALTSSPPISARPPKTASVRLPPNGMKPLGQSDAATPRPPSLIDEKQGAFQAAPPAHSAKGTIY